MTRKSIGLAAIIAAGFGLNCGKDRGATAPTTSPTGTNHAPAASTAVAPAAAPIAGATRLTFTANGNDPDGDTVTFGWQFGDGQTASGPTVSHVYGAAGTYAVVLAAADSHGETTKVTTIVVVKGLTGDWVDVDPRTGFTLEQQGSTFTGLNEVLNRGIAAVQGSVTDPRSISIELTYDVPIYPGRRHEQYRCYFQGTLDDAGDVFRVQANGRTSDMRCRQGSYTAQRQRQ